MNKRREYDFYDYYYHYNFTFDKKNGIIFIDIYYDNQNCTNNLKISFAIVIEIDLEAKFPLRKKTKIRTKNQPKSKFLF